jgi:hypothetical protein
MMANALSISILVTAGFYMLYQKLPARMKEYIVRYSLIADFFAMVATYYMFGGTVTALMAGAIVDLMISAMLHIANHPADFEWLFDIMKAIKELMEKARLALKNMNDSWKAKKAAAATPVFGQPVAEPVVA